MTDARGESATAITRRKKLQSATAGRNHSRGTWKQSNAPIGVALFHLTRVRHLMAVERRKRHAPVVSGLDVVAYPYVLTASVVLLSSTHPSRRFDGSVQAHAVHASRTAARKSGKRVGGERRTLHQANPRQTKSRRRRRRRRRRPYCNPWMSTVHARPVCLSRLACRCRVWALGSSVVI